MGASATDCGGGGDHILSSAEKALNNPIIVREILQNGVVEGKIARQVCRLWNEVVLSLPQPKIVLNLQIGDRMCCDTGPFLKLCLTMEPRLARSVVDMGCITRNDEEGRPDLHNKFQTISSCTSKWYFLLDKYSEYLEQLKLVFEYEELVPVCYELLKNCCPNLRKVDISCWNDDNYEDDDSNDDSDNEDNDQNNNDHNDDDIDVRLGENEPPLSIREKLEHIEIRHFYNFDTTARILGKLLIEAAPNLVSLESGCNILPDLSRHTKLKRFVIPAEPFEPMKIPGFSFEGLGRMLDQVKLTLEVLSFGKKDNERGFNETNNSFLFHWEPILPGLNFKLPPMPKLKEFVNKMIDVFTCGAGLEDLATARMPQLETLVISKGYDLDRSLDDLLRTAMERKVQFSVKRLTISNVKDWGLLSGFKTCFQRLQHLYVKRSPWIKFKEEEEDGSLSHPHQLRDILANCANLKLTSLEVDLDTYPQKLSDFLDCFVGRDKDLLRKDGLKQLKINTMDDYPVEDNLDIDGIKMFSDIFAALTVDNFATLGVKFKEENELAIRSLIAAAAELSKK